MVEHEEEVKIIEFINKKKQDFSSISSIFDREIIFSENFKNFNEFYNIVAEQRDLICWLFNISKIVKPSCFYKFDTAKHFKLPFQILKGSTKFSKTNLTRLSRYELAFSVVCCITFHINKTNKTKYLYMFDALLTKNVSDFLIFDKNIDDYKQIKKAISILGNGFKSNLNNFNCNYNGKHFESSISFEKLIKRIFLSEDGFRFYYKQPKKLLFFNEKIIYDCLSISINKDGTLSPLVSIGNSKFPNFDFQSKNVFPKLINDFAKYDYCTAVLELILYLTNRENMSQKTVNLLIDKFEKGIKTSSFWKNESMLNLFCCLIFEKKMVPANMNEFRNRIMPLLGKKRDIRPLIQISSTGMDVGKNNKKRIKNHNKKITLEKLKHINTLEGLRELFCFDFPKKMISLEKIQIISNSFYNQIKMLNNGVEIAHLYCQFMSFLNKEIIFNVDPNFLELEKLKLFNRWDKKDYKRCLSLMQTININGPKINVKEAIDQCNNEIISDPRNFGYIIFSHDEKSFLQMLERGSETFYNKFCQNIDVAKPFPRIVKIKADNFLPKIIIPEIEYYLNNFGYRMLNNYNARDYLQDYYGDVSQSITYGSAFFTKEKQLYNMIKRKFRKSKLLKWNDEPSYADLTQLFPLIESQIILNAKYNGISPLRSDTNSSVLKEPSTILLRRFKNAQCLFGNLESVSDLIFVYLILFDANSFNIRNKVVHGVEYPLDVEKLKYYRKLTIIALAIIVKRNETEK